MNGLVFLVIVIAAGWLFTEMTRRHGRQVMDQASERAELERLREENEQLDRRLDELGDKDR